MKSRLRHGKGEKQMRMFPKLKMPLAPLESTIVDAARTAIGYLAFTIVWSGRVFSTGRMPFIPALGKGTPDLVGVTRGRMWAIEFKRDESEEERATQEKWRRRAELAGVRVYTECTDAQAAFEFVRELAKEAA